MSYTPQYAYEVFKQAGGYYVAQWRTGDHVLTGMAGPFADRPMSNDQDYEAWYDLSSEKIRRVLTTLPLGVL